MKKMIVSTKHLMILAVMMVMTISARSAMPLGSSKNAMSYNAAKHEALFLSDKMAYELNLTAAQYEAVADLRYVLNAWQYDKYITLAHFYRPVAWKAGGWTFAVYSHYDRARFFNAHPKVFVTYRGGNSHRDPRFYAGRHMPKPAVHHKAPVPAPHNGKSAVAHNDRHGSDRHMAMNTSRGNGGHFGRR